MSEELLKALMQLFAMASDVDDITQESRVIVNDYLTQELNSELVPTYLDLLIKMSLKFALKSMLFYNKSKK